MRHLFHWKTFSRYSALLAGLLLPAIALAAPANMKELSSLIVRILQSISGILFASLAVGLVYGVVLYFINSDSEQKREQIKGYLLWGIIGIAVVFGLWGILMILSTTFGWGNVGIPLLSAPA